MHIYYFLTAKMCKLLKEQTSFVQKVIFWRKKNLGYSFYTKKSCRLARQCLLIQHTFVTAIFWWNLPKREETVFLTAFYMHTAQNRCLNMIWISSITLQFGWENKAFLCVFNNGFGNLIHTFLSFLINRNWQNLRFTIRGKSNA